MNAEELSEMKSRIAKSIEVVFDSVWMLHTQICFTFRHQFAKQLIPTSTKLVENQNKLFSKFLLSGPFKRRIADRNYDLIDSITQGLECKLSKVESERKSNWNLRLFK